VTEQPDVTTGPVVVIRATLDIDPADEAAFLAAVEPLVATTHTEAGCNQYEFSRSLRVPGRFHIIEEWADAASRDAHMRADHFKAFGLALRGLRVLGRDVHRYVIAEHTTF
jgi:quinol monooxygenase YgiN